jgi:hypothetical protein
VVAVVVEPQQQRCERGIVAIDASIVIGVERSECGIAIPPRAAIGPPDLRRPARAAALQRRRDRVQHVGACVDAARHRVTGAVTRIKPLTEAYLTDPSNCWATAVAQFAAAIPQRTTTGTLSADRSTCSFADGAVVRFDQPVPGAVQAGAFQFYVDDSVCADCPAGPGVPSFGGIVGNDGAFTGNSGNGFGIEFTTNAPGLTSATIQVDDYYALGCETGIYPDGWTSHMEKRSTVDTWPARIVPNFALAIDATGIAFALTASVPSGRCSRARWEAALSERARAARSARCALGQRRGCSGTW